MAARFVDCGLVTVTVTYLPSSAPSSCPDNEWGRFAGPCRLPSDRRGPFHRVGALDRQGENLTLRKGSERLATSFEQLVQLRAS